MSLLKEYLKDRRLGEMFRAIRQAGAIRSVSLDITHRCNLRCRGCYYFSDGMDSIPTDGAEGNFQQFLISEKKRGTNFVTIVGGEPSLELGRLKQVYDQFKVNVATNGLVKIPVDGFENLPIGVAVWGNHETDAQLRIEGRKDLFKQALQNYRDDDRAFWYYTVAPGCADQVEEVVEECIQNGNRVLFNYYSDIQGLGGQLDYRTGFGKVRDEIDRMIEKYPDRIYTTSYLNRVVTEGRLMGESWGYDVCTNISANFQGNALRILNGNPYNEHFRAYNADFLTTRRCCTGTARDCDSCYDTWERFSWIMINVKKHLANRQDFVHWLTTMYTFYMVNRFIVPHDAGAALRDIHALESEHVGIGVDAREEGNG